MSLFNFPCDNLRFHHFVQNENIRPFLQNIPGLCLHQFDKVFSDCAGKRTPVRHSAKPDGNNFSITRDDLGFGLKFAITAMDMHRQMFACEKENQDPKIFIKFGHENSCVRLIHQFLFPIRIIHYIHRVAFRQQPRIKCLASVKGLNLPCGFNFRRTFFGLEAQKQLLHQRGARALGQRKRFDENGFCVCAHNV